MSIRARERERERDAGVVAGRCDSGGATSRALATLGRVLLTLDAADNPRDAGPEAQDPALGVQTLRASTEFPRRGAARRVAADPHQSLPSGSNYFGRYPASGRT